MPTFLLQSFLASLLCADADATLWLPGPAACPQVGEVLDYWGDAGAIAWRLTDNDVRQTLSQRVDVSPHEILALKL